MVDGGTVLRYFELSSTAYIRKRNTFKKHRLIDGIMLGFLLSQACIKPLSKYFTLYARICTHFFPTQLWLLANSCRAVGWSYLHFNTFCCTYSEQVKCGLWVLHCTVLFSRHKVLISPVIKFLRDNNVRTKKTCLLEKRPTLQAKAKS